MSLPPHPTHHSIKPYQKPTNLKSSHRSSISNRQNYSLMVDTSNIL